MIDDEMSCKPNPNWLKDFKQEIQEEFNLSSLDATCIAGKVARIVRMRDKKACEWLMKQYEEDDMDMVSASAFIYDFRKAMEE